MANDHGLSHCLCMVMIPAFCSKCGLPTPSMVEARDIRNSIINITIPCSQPDCGGMARTLPGPINVIGEEIQLLSPEGVSALKDIVERLSSGEIEQEEAIRAIAKVKPPLAAMLSTFMAEHGWPLLAILVAIVFGIRNEMSNAATARQLAEWTASLQRQASNAQSNAQGTPARAKPPPKPSEIETPRTSQAQTSSDADEKRRIGKRAQRRARGRAKERRK